MGRELEYFVRQALQFGKEQFSKADNLNKAAVSFADTGFMFAESEPFLMSSIKLCLNADKPELNNTLPAAIYADYSAWHINNGFHAPHAKHTDLLEMCKTLASFGVSANYYQPDQRWDVFDNKQSFGVRLQCGLDRSPIWEKTAPLANFCNWVARQDSKTMVHAASIGIEGMGALLIGNGGAGKSGTILGCLMRGFKSSGDDYTIISNGSNYAAHALYMSVKQDPLGLKRLGLKCDQNLNWQGKAVFRPRDIINADISPSMPINVLIVPSIGADKTTFQSVSPNEVFKILALSTAKQLGSDHAQIFKACGDLVRTIPCFKMNMSSDNDEVTVELKKFLREIKC